MIKAASIAYAIFMALITALVCYGFVLVFSVNTQIEDHYELRSDLLRQRFSAQALAKAHFNELSQMTTEFIVDPSKGIKVQLSKQPWGFLDLVKTEVFNTQESFSQQYLMGWSKAVNDPIFYVRNNDEPLKISGTTSLVGTIYSSAVNIKKITVNGQTSQKAKHLGAKRVAKKVMPSYQLPEEFVPQNWQEGFLESLDDKMLIQDFTEPTMIFKVTNLLEDITLKGNIVVRSTDTLTIKKTALLEDIIVLAPKVVFEAGFKGSLQVIAGAHIETEDNVQLDYPSVLVVSGTNDQLNSIKIGAQCTIAGAVILTGNGLAFEQQQELVVQKDSKIDGLLYCDGVLELYGDVQGTVISSALLYKTSSTRYSNLLKDVSLSELPKPELFFGIELPELGSGAPLIVKKV